MNEKNKLHIKKLQNRALLSLIVGIIVIISFVFGIISFFITPFAAVAFFAVAVISIVYFIFINHSSKREEKEGAFESIKFTADKSLSFEEIVEIFESLTDKENQLSISNDVRFFRLNKIFKLRTVVYKTESFNKRDFDNAKDRINKKANKELNISPWVNKFEARKMMRFNVICTDTLNDTLYQFLSQNAKHNLTRVEGIINIAIVGNQVIIPPIYGECDLDEINRYKGVIKFINQILLNK